MTSAVDINDRIAEVLKKAKIWTPPEDKVRRRHAVNKFIVLLLDSGLGIALREHIRPDD